MNQRGSLLLSFGLGIALLLMSLGLFGYLNAGNTNTRYSMQRSLLDSHASYVFAKVSRCLTDLTSASGCPKAAQFRTLLRLSKTVSTNPDPAPVTLSFADIKGQAGFLTERLTELDDFFSDVSLIISRNYSDDDVWFGGTKVVISLSMTPKSFMLKKREYMRAYQLNILSPSSFAVIIRDGGPTPSFNLTGGSKIAIYGGALLWKNSTDTLAPGQVYGTASTSFTIDQIWSQAQGLAITSSDTIDSINPLVSSGLRLRTLNGIDNPFTSVAFWNQPLDYLYVFASTGGYPLPSNVGTAGHGGNDPRDVNTGRATVTTYPEVSNMGTQNLQATCERPTSFLNGSMKELILLRLSSNLTFDFALNPVAGVSAKYGCGMVVAQRVTFNVPVGESVVWYGHVNATQIVVTGGGTISIVSPFSSNSRPSNLAAPANMPISEIAQVFLTLASSTARNFFVPFSYDIPSLGASLQYDQMSSHMTPCGGKQCWTLFVDPPNLTTSMNTTPWYDYLLMTVQENL